jgi:hypothetical protein
VLGNGQIEAAFIRSLTGSLSPCPVPGQIRQPVPGSGGSIATPRPLPLHHRQRPHRLGRRCPAGTTRRAPRHHHDRLPAQQRYIIPKYQDAIDTFVEAGGDPSIPVAILGVQESYLNAAFDEMETQYGSIENYFAEGLGIDAAGQQALRHSPVSDAYYNQAPFTYSGTIRRFDVKYAG